MIQINPELFDKVYLPHYNNRQRYQIYFGGGSSGKSFTFMNYALFWALEGRNVLIVRKYGAQLERSSWSELIVAMDELELTQYFIIQKSNKTIISKISGGSLMLSGIDNQEKIKSIRSPRPGAIDTVLADEATELTPGDIHQLKIRQRGKSNFRKRLIMIFNPIAITHHIYLSYFKELVDNGKWNGRFYSDDKLLILKTTYKDNSHLAVEDIETLEDLKITTPYHYNVYGLGNWGTLGDKIYTNFNTCKVEDIPSRCKLRLGVDWGYNDPTCLTVSYYDASTRSIYVVDEVYLKESAPDVIIDAFEACFARNNISKTTMITCDTSEPRMRDALLTAGFTAKNAKKGSGSKIAGIMWLKQMHIYYTPNCNHMRNAVDLYSWKKDKNGVSLDEPLHDGSDMLDALKYSFEQDMKGNRGVVGINKQHKGW